MSEEPTNRKDTGRNPDGTFKPGVSGNPNGKPKDTLKAFIAREFREMDDDAKREWLKNNHVSADIIWKMAEGNPSNATELTGKDGESLFNNEQKEASKKATGEFITGDTEQGD